MIMLVNTHDQLLTLKKRLLKECYKQHAAPEFGGIIDPDEDPVGAWAQEALEKLHTIIMECEEYEE